MESLGKDPSSFILLVTRNPRFHHEAITDVWRYIICFWMSLGIEANSIHQTSMERTLTRLENH